MTAADPQIPSAWSHLPFFTHDWPRLSALLASEPREVLPPSAQRFAALDACAPDQVRVVILGQDPYPTPGHANGLAFSVAPDVRPLPRSLNNIFKELQGDLHAIPADGDLTFWARQGVLLLNTALSVPAGEAGGHRKLGWDRLAAQVLRALDDRPRAFLLWGNHAQSVCPDPAAHHLVIRTAHPSPLSARRGFFGSRPFSRVNEWLIANGDTPINWTTP